MYVLICWRFAVSSASGIGCAGLRPTRSGKRKNGELMTTRLLLIATAVSLTMASVAAYAGYGTTGTGWNQVAADAAARAYAAEGKCYPINGPCPAPPPTLHPYRTPHATQQHKRQLH